ncbi:hypothetical protein AVEN_106693-1 [Araneus ventricosus]|uniref:Uncharacterized protein n=1 Tax=Araneus ventricosus TaxID=182803 RepID=A0A4Y2R0K7_ARAVE|nr:hypothetical protein AVEN_106693-1 [Araneus ventricosus]
MPGMSYGQDLAVNNIHRGRDHGLAPYVDVVKFCSDGTILISSFDDLKNYGLMSKKNADLLKRIYAAVEDVDMWVGMQKENHMPPSRYGSINCLHQRQAILFQPERRQILLRPQRPEVSLYNRNPVVSCNEIPEIDLMLWKGTEDGASAS